MARLLDESAPMKTITLRWTSLVCLSAASLLGGCAAGPNPIDPYEKTNRSLYNFNEGLDRFVLKPMADFYVGVFPRPIRIGLGNAFDNLVYGNVIFNDFLQGKWGQGWGDFGRFAVNSTVGIGGIFDVATGWHLPAHENDFGITLAKWGAKPGAYLVLPLFGPSSVRDAPGLGVKVLTNPITWIAAPWAATIPLAVSDIVDLRSRGGVLVNFRNEAALDPYVFTRDAYLQYRANVTHQAATQPDESLYDVDDTTAATAPATQPAKK